MRIITIYHGTASELLWIFSEIYSTNDVHRKILDAKEKLNLRG